MRIFKNRGDIYFSKTNKEKSTEQKILIIALAVIVVFTVVFVTALSVKYDFSAKKFFAPDDLQVTQISQEEDTPLPQVSGKTNFVTLVNSDGKLLFVSLLQVDMDNVSYKTSVLKADTLCDGNTLADIYAGSGAQNVKKAVESLMGVSFDYYISMDNRKFSEFFDSLGDFNYPVLSEIKFKSRDKAVNYSLKLKAGEQKLSGQQVINLIRYNIEENNNTSATNDLMLNSLLQLVNSENAANSEELFKLLVTTADTNITVRDFSLSGDNITVLADDRTGAGAYSAVAEYEGNSLSKESLQKIKGYFVK